MKAAKFLDFISYNPQIDLDSLEVYTCDDVIDILKKISLTDKIEHVLNGWNDTNYDKCINEIYDIMSDSEVEDGNDD